MREDSDHSAFALDGEAGEARRGGKPARGKASKPAGKSTKTAAGNPTPRKSAGKATGKAAGKAEKAARNAKRRAR